MTPVRKPLEPILTDYNTHNIRMKFVYFGQKRLIGEDSIIIMTDPIPILGIRGASNGYHYYL